MESRRIARAGRRASSAVETYPWSRVNVFALRRTNSSPFVYKVPGSSNHRRQSRRARSMRESRARARSMRPPARIENPSRRVRTASSPSSRRDTPRRRDTRAAGECRERRRRSRRSSDRRRARRAAGIASSATARVDIRTSCMPRSRVVDLFGRCVTRHVVTTVVVCVVFKKSYSVDSTNFRRIRARCAHMMVQRYHYI